MTDEKEREIRETVETARFLRKRGKNRRHRRRRRCVKQNGNMEKRSDEQNDETCTWSR